MANETIPAPTPASATSDGGAGAAAHAASEDPRIRSAVTHIQGMLVPGETLEAFAVQRRLFALHKRRSVIAATTGRFIAVTRGLFGGYTPADVRWQDVEDAHLRVGIFGADVTVTALHHEDLATAGHVGGSLGGLGLRKDQAEQVYRVCQAQSQAWREKRRVRDLDEMRARSGGIQLGGGGAAGSAGAGATGDGPADPVARLQRAKEMLGAGLITDAEFESIKAKIVDRL